MPTGEARRRCLRGGTDGVRQFPVVNPGSADTTFAGPDEAFVARLDFVLSVLHRASFLGGSGADTANAIALHYAYTSGANPAGIFVAGTTESRLPGIGPASADPLFGGGTEGSWRS
jgi:hypothetical protein